MQYVDLTPIGTEDAAVQLRTGRLWCALVTDDQRVDLRFQCKNADQSFRHVEFAEATHVQAKRGNVKVFTYHPKDQSWRFEYDKLGGQAALAVMLHLAGVRPLRLGTKLIVTSSGASGSAEDHEWRERSKQATGEYLDRPTRYTHEMVQYLARVEEQTRNQIAIALDVSAALGKRDEFESALAAAGEDDSPVTYQVEQAMKDWTDSTLRMALAAYIRYRGLARSHEAAKQAEEASLATL